jgi:hypothetical protein
MGAGTANYGLITRYYPRGRIAATTITQTGGNVWLSVTLAHGGAEETLGLLFEPSAEESLRELAAKLGENVP